ncbi:hypothetical protein BDB01DRAFT_728701 [Pilobolus umbonatus]|nr:hypothetical protein BDB01DRAFT_728701 [Pilobolus umbonatus]
MEESEEEEEEIAVGEASTSTVKPRKLGKKRGVKMMKKEQMRQYREFMDQQKEIRRAKEEKEEEEFRRRKFEESLKTADELSRLRKEQTKKLKMAEKEALKNEKLRETRYMKNKMKVISALKEHKLVSLDTLAMKIGLSEEDTKEIVNRLCKEESEFRLSFWSSSMQFLYVTEEDYVRWNKQLNEKGKLSIHEGRLEC